MIVSNQIFKYCHDQIFIEAFFLNHLFLPFVNLKLVYVNSAFLNHSLQSLISIGSRHKPKIHLAASMEVEWPPILPILLLNFASSCVASHVNEQAASEANIKLQIIAWFKFNLRGMYSMVIIKFLKLSL